MDSQLKHYFFTITLLASLILIISCEDASVIDGKLRVSTNMGNGTGTVVVNNTIGEKEYGYAELTFQLESNTAEVVIGIAARAENPDSFYTCLVGKSGGQSYKMNVQYYGGSNIKDEQNSLPNDVLTIGEHVIGCEVVATPIGDQIRTYLDGVLTNTYTVGEGNQNTIETGKFGIIGQNNTEDMYLKSFKFYDKKP